MSRLRTTHLLPAAVAVLALTLTGCGAQDEQDTAADPASTETPSDASSESSSDSSSTTDPGADTLALTADGSMAGKCAMPNAETLATFDTAFAGTVTSLEDGTATLSVEEWYAGDEAATVTVDAPSQNLQDLLMAVDFQEGRTYLVSATDTRVTLCGFTAEESPDLQALYDEAYPQ